ncbi:MAG: universal stress protein [Spirochaetes bacterium]|nr:universal stress protein [Spirochaetota bacterium]
MKKGMYQKAILAVDGSEEGLRAAKFAVMLSKNLSIELLALYVVDTATIKELLLSKIFIDEESKEYESSLEKNGDKYLKLVNEMALSKKVKIETILEHGSIYGKIIEMALEKNADLIILGGRKKTLKKDPSSRDLLSNEYIKVLRESAVSVLFVKGEEIDKQFDKF